MKEASSVYHALHRVLDERGETLSVGESCTGGLIAHRITEIPGASRIFLLGVVAYSNEAKVALLGVRPETLDRCGAVSEEVAREMAAGAARAGGSTFGIGVTGIAGPGGGSREKPVGTVCVGACRSGRAEAVSARLEFAGTRSGIKAMSAAAAVRFLLEYLSSG
jgi:nicotinamide-nucleotide amidase